MGGGGLWIGNPGTDVRMIDCSIYGNAGVQGAGIAIHSARLTMIGCSIHDNEARHRGGGGLDLQGGADVTMVRCSVHGNRAQSPRPIEAPIVDGGGGFVIRAHPADGRGPRLTMNGC